MHPYRQVSVDGAAGAEFLLREHQRRGGVVLAGDDDDDGIVHAGVGVYRGACDLSPATFGATIGFSGTHPPAPPQVDSTITALWGVAAHAA